MTRAVVAGASVGGLSAAAAVAPFFDEVVVLSATSPRSPGANAGRRPVRRRRRCPLSDLVGRDSTAAAPGRKLVGDITYVSTDEGRLYPATWRDLATREIVGYSMADHHRASLVVDALTKARRPRRPPARPRRALGPRSGVHR